MQLVHAVQVLGWPVLHTLLQFLLAAGALLATTTPL